MSEIRDDAVRYGLPPVPGRGLVAGKSMEKPQRGGKRLLVRGGVERALISARESEAVLKVRINP